MADVEKYAKEMVEVVEAADSFKKTIANACGGSFKWGIEQVVESYLSMFDRFCPFEEGDRVELIEDYDTSNSPGWASSKHFLIKGSKATVSDRGYRDGYFTFSVVFDNETWVDRNGCEQPVSNKHTFGFRESRLKKCDEPKEQKITPLDPLDNNEHSPF